MTNLLRVIGCRAGSPGRNGPASGYLLEVGDRRILLDCGPGVLAGLTTRGLAENIDAVIITHRHADHSADLAPFGYHRSFPVVQPPLPLFGPTGITEYFDSLDALHGIPSIPEMATPIATQFPPTEVEPGSSFEVVGVRVDTVLAQHPVPCISLRFPDVGLVYTSDTGITDDLVELSRGARVLLGEATYPTEEGRDFSAHGHMGGAELGRLARAAAVDHLVVTHLSDIGQAAETEKHLRTEFTGRATFAEPGQIYSL